MIKNKSIINKIKEKTKDDADMSMFLINILNHENDNSQYKKEYEKLIDKYIKNRSK
ncbi:hypothetical protein [Peptacetobacter hominis]|uniref:hypothetical protein n=1 Tax=Peptacetobacter hominis TaxID=2743610 RepID=UPI0015816BF7|nr:hypothetical protein [Peptacetobacter hominis]